MNNPYIEECAIEDFLYGESFDTPIVFSHDVDKERYRTKRCNTRNYQAKLRRLSQYGYFRVVWESDGRIMKDSISVGKNSVADFLKRLSNKIVRRYTKRISDGNAYRKLFDYWWTID